MNETDRLCNLLYSFMFSEDKRLETEVDNCYHLLKQNDDDLLCIENYRQSVQRYKDFKILERKVFELLKRF